MAGGKPENPEGNPSEPGTTTNSTQMRPQVLWVYFLKKLVLRRWEIETQETG